MRIEANISELENASSTMNKLASDYASEYAALINEVKAIQGSGWVGEDAQTFVNKIEGLRDDFDRMRDLMLGASKDLQESAREYQQTTKTAVSSAGSLADSF